MQVFQSSQRDVKAILQHGTYVLRVSQQSSVDRRPDVTAFF